jgi:SulP family sulfate permease
MPVAAAVVRSVAAVQAGASSRLAPVVQSIALALVLLVFAPLVSYIPLVSLAAILLVVGFRLIQWQNLVRMWHVARLEAFIFVGTAAGILFTDFVFGVAIGMIGALAHFAVQQGAALRARKTVLAVAAATDSARARERDVPVVRLEGPLFFGSQAQLEDAISHAEARETLHIDVSKVSTVDVSGAMAFANALKRIADEGVSIRVSGREGGLDPVLHWGLEQVNHERISIVETASARSSYEPSTLTVPRRSARPSVQTGVYPTIQIERS